MHEINIQYIIVVQLYSNLLKSGQVGFRVISGFRSFGFGSGQILSRLISDYLGFRIG
jgi:hypothetical protein